MNAFRSFHVLFALAVIAGYVTSEEFGLAHAWIGYGVATLILVRIVLGVARRRGFEFRRLTPRLGGLALSKAGLRHPAIASGLTLALALCVTGSAATGLAMDRGGTLVGNSIRSHDDDHERRHGRRHGDDRDEDEHARAAPSDMLGLASPALAGDGEDEAEEEDEGALGEMHEVFGNALLPLAILHLVYMLIFRFDMARYVLFVPRRKQG